jgi:hypothetical protein
MVDGKDVNVEARLCRLHRSGYAPASGSPLSPSPFVAAG